MNYLAIDASTEACSVALNYQGNVYQRYDLCPQSHSLMLLPMVDEVLSEAGVKLNQLDGLLFGRGPGSFTGVRIGIGVAQGLAFASDLKLAGISTLQTMAQLAYESFGQTQVLAAIDARMGEVYCGLYRLDEHKLMQPVLNETVIAPQLVNDYVSDAINDNQCFGVGSAWQAYPEQLANISSITVNKEVEFPKAVAMLNLGKHQFAVGATVNAEDAQPVYVRDTVSWKKLPGRD